LNGRTGIVHIVYRVQNVLHRGLVVFRWVHLGCGPDDFEREGEVTVIQWVLFVGLIKPEAEAVLEE
jgi:hypothetical protein